ncbi:DUF4142 domain-containing protein [Rufibacter immobilis]|uniref:DUF4142 domain-containing protein n=1 Tax=Rufibacter immobilis TaxID=1348778 RepID=A0A3M9MYG1_9BACT|nr:DUF4142 domain-containing protein [Rufibacter immobilis]RNI30177.1 DUF4142 domain-containing protein [Rufibacter immobilis]
MKKSMLILAAGAMFTASACSSTSTDTTGNNTSTAGTASSTDASYGGGTAGTTTGTTGTTGGTSGATAGTTMDMTNMTDAMFMMTAASSNMLEIQAGKLAAQKATNADVKKFAQMMVDHHTKANQEMMTLASQMKVTLPKTLMPPHQAIMDKLNNKTGKDFDEEYMDAMETAHDMDIAMFQMKSNNAETPTVKAMAAKTLPMLQSHKKMATALEDKVD